MALVGLSQSNPNRVDEEKFFIGKEVALLDIDFGAAVNGSMGPAGAVESVLEAIQSQFTILENISSFIGDDLSAASDSPNNTWINSATETMKYDEIINYWLKFYNYEYNYGQIMFFRSHKNITRIILPKIVNSQFSYQFLETTSDSPVTKL